MLKTDIGRLRIIAFLEGLSFLLLLFVAMPLKYYGGYTEATKELGMAHGVLFTMYVIAVFPAKEQKGWSWFTTLVVLAASVFPFGTFVADYKLFRD